LRERFSAKVRGRFNALKRSGVKRVKDDSLTESDKTGALFVAYFFPWFDRESKEIVIGDNGWYKSFVNQAALAGIARTDLYIKAIGNENGAALTTPRPEDIRDIESYYERFAEGLGVILAALTIEARTALLKAIQEQQDVAAALADRIDKIGRTRGEVLARTETISIFNDAALTRMEMLGILYVTAQLEYEFVTAGDERVCPICAALDGKIYAIAQARGVIPLHPRCRCSWVPVWL